MTTAALKAEPETIAAITALTSELGHDPSPVDLAVRLNISRQLAQYRITVLERAGRVERINHGHAVRIK